MKRLIINADDFGLAPGVNRAVLELERGGALSSATLMANGDCFQQAVHLGFAQPSLAIGCHVVLVDGFPYLHPEEVPSLIDPSHRSTQQLRPTVGAFVQDLVRNRIRERDIQAEAIAQIRRIQRSGFTVSHVDSHKHLHAFPRVLAPLLRAAQYCGVQSVRNPFEPAWSRRVVKKAGVLRRVQMRAVATQQRAWRRTVREYGVHTTDGALGVLATGVLDQGILEALLTAMPEGTWELVCHPGYLDAELGKVRTRLLGSREVERTALMQVVPEWLRQHRDLQLINFHQVGRPV